MDGVGFEEKGLVVDKEKTCRFGPPAPRGVPSRWKTGSKAQAVRSRQSTPGVAGDIRGIGCHRLPLSLLLPNGGFQELQTMCPIGVRVDGQVLCDAIAAKRILPLFSIALT